MLSYYTTYQSTITTMPFKLLCVAKPQLPSFPNPEIQSVRYGESSAAEKIQLLPKIRFFAKKLLKNTVKIQRQY
jgi:hypothetical protein